MKLRTLYLAGLAGVLSGCAALRYQMPKNSLRASYPNGIYFDGFEDRNGQKSFTVFDWTAPSSGPTPPTGPVRCPVALQYGSLTLSQKQFVSPSAMRALGGKTQNVHGLDSDVVLNTPSPGYCVALDYSNGRLWHVHIISDDPKTIITVGGKSMNLPLSQDTLFAVLGSPAQYQSTEVQIN